MQPPFPGSRGDSRARHATQPGVPPRSGADRRTEAPNPQRDLRV